MNEPQECTDITRRFFEALDMIKVSETHTRLSDLHARV